MPWPQHRPYTASVAEAEGCTQSYQTSRVWKVSPKTASQTGAIKSFSSFYGIF